MAIRKRTKRPSDHQIDEQWAEQYDPALMYGAKIGTDQVESFDGSQGSPVAVLDSGNPVGIFNIIDFVGGTITDTSIGDIKQVQVDLNSTGATYVDDVQTGITGTTVTLPSTPSDELRVFRNGVLQERNNDYTITANVITFSVALTSGETVESLYKTGGTVAGYTEDIQTGITGTVLNLPSVPSRELRIFRNGVLQVKGVDYTQAGTVVTFTTPLVASETIISLYIA